MDDEASDGRRALHRIADALGVPVERLFHPGEHSRAPSPPRAEVRALMRAFCRVGDPETRSLLLRMVEEAASVEHASLHRAV